VGRTNSTVGSIWGCARARGLGDDESDDGDLGDDESDDGDLGDDESDFGDEGESDDEQGDEDSCPAGALHPGARVTEAELELTADGLVFTDIELLL
jgi:hypothetical protein